MELKKIQHILSEKMDKSKQSVLNDRFEEYYNVLHYIENLYLTQGNLDNDLPEYLLINIVKSDSQWELTWNTAGS